MNVLVLATLWHPGLNPIGWESMLPLGVVAGYALIMWLTRARSLRLAAALLFTVAAGLMEASPLVVGTCRVFPDADDFVGHDLLALAAVWLALRIARSGSLGNLMYGGAVLLLAGGLLALTFVERVALLIACAGVLDLDAWHILLAFLLVWGAGYAILMTWLARSSRRVRQSGSGASPGRVAPSDSESEAHRATSQWERKRRKRCQDDLS